MPPYRLLDAEEHAAAHPRSFFIPSRETRTGLRVGDTVKLVFRAAGGDADGEGERMWVEVTDTAPGGYVGTLANDPIVIDLQPGARVEFEPRHVIDVWSDDPDPYEDHTLLVSARLLEDDDLEVGFVRFEPDDAGRPLGDGRVFSGWELYVGDETDAELDDPDRIRLPAFGWVLLRYPDVLPLVEGHDGSESAWLRRADGGFRPVGPDGT